MMKSKLFVRFCFNKAKQWKWLDQIEQKKLVQVNQFRFVDTI